MIRILNHHTRNIEEKKAFLTNNGIPFKVFTDETDFYKKRDTRRKGFKMNFINLMSWDSTEDYVLMIHDDMTLSKDLLENILHVRKFAPKKNMLCFFNPTNNEYKEAFEKGRLVYQTYSNFWAPLILLPKEMAIGIVTFLKENPQFADDNNCSEDSILKGYMAINNKPVYVVMPSMSQHDGFDKSVLGNPSKCGKNVRQSFTYEVDFDYKSIDWVSHFNNPYVHNKKQYL